MQARMTEGLHHEAPGLDQRPTSEMARIFHKGQSEALTAVEGAYAEIAAGAELMAAAYSNGGQLHVAAAGSSGLMAAADMMELPGTFGLDPARLRIHMAGGLPQSAEMPGGTEDDLSEAQIAAQSVEAGDAVIVVSASGSTPYALAFAAEAQARDAKVIAIANVSGAPLFDVAGVAICLPTPPEVIAGSTRLGAGTAQKVALNMMSSIMGVLLGHVHDGMMVNLRADNIKLRDRAAGMVARIASVGRDAALGYLNDAEGAVKPAILLASGAPDAREAHDMLTQTKGHLRAALAQLNHRREGAGT